VIIRAAQVMDNTKLVGLCNTTKINPRVSRLYIIRLAYIAYTAISLVISNAIIQASKVKQTKSNSRILKKQ